jgi:putative membrane-bound dehydrogenase-like protein
MAIILAEKEYKTDKSVPAFFDAELKPLGFSASYVTAPGEGDERNDLKGLEKALAKADLLFVSARRRAPKLSQMKAIRAWVQKGKPVIAIRTANHAFHLRGKPVPKGHALWEEWDNNVLGGNYSNHHGNSKNTWYQFESTAKGHPVLKGIQSSEEVSSGGSLYKVLPLSKTTELLAWGRVQGVDQKEPVAWTNKPVTGNRVFFTTLGHLKDFEQPTFKLLLLNAIHWTLKHQTPGKLQKDPPKKESRLPELKTPEDLEIELVLREPQIANPLYLNFDERGRLWVVEYRQYPWPAGLRMVTHDKVYRNAYDPAYPPPPPHALGSPFRGKDRVSIHEDTNGDGTFDSHKVFLDGLNLATAALPGCGGVFVLNPPYLLFYSDKDRDDQPDSPTPRVLLSGFGLEDSHSIANNLRWGPDGWIYATHGSTVTANVVLHGPDNKPLPEFKPIHRMGQFVWRYHPETHRFEIFAEGGGNAFGVEIDSKGRLYSGHNGGDTRGFHYVQGGYYRKTFGKHGNLSNPYAFGHFPAMAHPKVKRFTHTFEIYEGTALPERYHGKLFGAAPVLRYVVASDLNPHGSTFRTEDIDHPISIGDDPRDRWFSPVEIQTGPDGNLYVADFHARQVAHYVAYSKGLTDADLGRIYRLKAKGSKPTELGTPFSKKSLLKTTLGHPNRWHRETALRLLGDQKDFSLIPKLRIVLRKETGQSALQALWALNLCGGFGKEVALEALEHRNSHVRRWTVRLLGDQREVSQEIAARLAELAKQEPDAEVRSQLAASARRLPARVGLPILGHLVRREEDISDPHLPLMVWWGFEGHAANHVAALNYFAKPENWQGVLLVDGAPPQQNLMRRWALSGEQIDLEACSRLLDLAPNPEQTAQLLQGFGKAFDGRSLPPFPDSLVRALSKARGHENLILELRRKDKVATRKVLVQLKDHNESLDLRIQIARVLGDVREDTAVPALLEILTKGERNALRQEALLSLQKFSHPNIGKTITNSFRDLPKELRPGAMQLLASRASWALALVEACSSGVIPPKTLDSETLNKLRLHNSSELKDKIQKTFGPSLVRSETNLDQELSNYRALAAAGGGNPKTGEGIYFGKAGCATCHVLFDKGGRIGPDLTPYDRSDLDAILLAIVRPSAEIREGYEHNLLTTKDGRILSGFKVEENPQVVILRGLDGHDHLVPRKEIASFTPLERSLMPEGLLSSLETEELRHLFAYLASTTPPK